MTVEIRCATMITVASAEISRSAARTGVGVHVERGERVVEQVDGRPADDGPGDGQPLPLAAGEVDAALRDAHVAARRRESRTKLVGRGHPQRVPHLVVGRVRASRSAGSRRPFRRTGNRVAAPGRWPTTAARCRSRAHRRRRRARLRRSRRTSGRSATPASTSPNPCDPTIAVVVPGRAVSETACSTGFSAPG